MIKVYHNFFSDDECSQIVNDVYSIQHLWLEHSSYSGKINYLGRSMLLELGKHQYNTSIAKESYLNAPNYTGRMHDILIKNMTNLFPKVSYMKQLGKPGIHILQEEKSRMWHTHFEKPLFSYELEFPDYTNNFNEFFSLDYTFTIMLTDGEFTFDYYDDELCKVHENCISPQCKSIPYTTIHYKKGDLVLQEKKNLHRIGPSKFYNDARIAIQGLAVIKDDTFYMYW